MPTTGQDQRFRDEILSEVPSNLLDIAIDWISRNLEPDEVFSVSRLEKWAENEGGFIKPE